MIQIALFNPFDEVWETELVPLLKSTPDLSPITLLEYLQEKYGNDYPDSLHRTLQRRIKNWRALNGPYKDVIFRRKIPVAFGQ